MAAPVEKEKRHVALFPSAEMGHFMPFLHLARTLAIHHGFTVTFITASQNVSPTETAHAQRLATSGLDIRVVKIHIEAHEANEDPFLAQCEAMRASMSAFENLLAADLLQQTPPVSAIITDPFLTPTLSIAAKFNIPNYVLFTASAFVLGLMLHYPHAEEQGFDFNDDKAVLQILGFPPLHAVQIPQALKIKDHVFRKLFLASGSELPKASGILVNTLEELEQQCLQSLRSRHALPPVYAIGPLFLPSYNSSTLDDEAERECLTWLDAQPAKSVVYVSFGSRSAMSAAQISELALGLEASQQRFLWVVRTSIVDGSDSAPAPLPAGFEQRVGQRGIIVSSWVPQVKILRHMSTGAFVSHCGWNSVVEGLCCGIPILAWPLAGDQMINAIIVVENAKAGIEVRKREDGIVSREEVANTVKAIVEKKDLTMAAIRFQQLGRMAIIEEGLSFKSLNVAFQLSIQTPKGVRICCKDGGLCRSPMSLSHEFDCNNSGGSPLKARHTAASSSSSFLRSSSSSPTQENLGYRTLQNNFLGSRLRDVLVARDVNHLISENGSNSPVKKTQQRIVPVPITVYNLTVRVDDGCEDFEKGEEAIDKKPPSPPLKRKRPPRLDIPQSTSLEPLPLNKEQPPKEVTTEGSHYAVVCKKGRREYMEDTHKAMVNFQGDSKQAFFGVFDGHGGRKAADFAAENIGNNIIDALVKIGDQQENIVQAVRDGYLATDAEFLKQGVTSGTSCVTALIKDGNMVVSNAGDCRAVISRKGHAEALTSDHRAAREDERERIENLGGYVDCRHGVWRVQGVLAISRGIGDLHMKDYILAEPDTKKIEINSDCEFLIMASDGLWDKVTNQEAVDLARPFCIGVKTEVENSSLPVGGPLAACRKLVELSVARGSLDDVSVMIVQLGNFCKRMD